MPSPPANSNTSKIPGPASGLPTLKIRRKSVTSASPKDDKAKAGSAPSTSSRRPARIPQNKVAPDRDEIRKLKEENAELKFDLEEAKAKATKENETPAEPPADRDEMIASYQQKLAELELKLQIATMGKENDTPANADLDKAKADGEKWKTKCLESGSELTRLRSMKSKNSSAFKDLEDQNEHLRKEVQKLEVKVGNIPGLESRLKEAAAAKGKVDAHLAETTDKIQTSDSKISELERQLIAKDERIQILENSGGQVVQLQESVSRLEQEKIALQNDLKGKLDEVEKQKLMLKTQVTEATRQKNDAIAAKDTLQGDFQRKLDQLEKDKTTLKDKLDDKVGPLEEQNSSLKTQLSRAKQQKDTAVADKLALESDLKGVLIEAEQDHNTIQQLKTSFAELEKQTLGLEEQLAEALKDQEDAINEATKAATERIGEARHEVEQLELELAEFRKEPKHDSFHDDIQVANDDYINQLHTQNEGLDAQLATAIEESQGKDAYVLQLEEHAAGLQDKVKELEILNSVSQDGKTDSTVSTVMQPANVIIKIDPAYRSSWTMMQKARAALAKQQLEIHGPVDLVALLKTEMAGHAWDFEATKEEVASLKKDIARLEQRGPCADPKHKNYKTLQDNVTALEAQLHMNNDMLQQYGQQMRKLKDENQAQDETAPEGPGTDTVL